MAVGDSSEIEIIYTVSGRAGKFSKAPRLYTSDPSAAESRVKIFGEGVDPNDSSKNQPISIDPPELKVTVGEENGDKFKINVKNISEDNLSMKLVSTHPDFIDVDVPGKDIKPGKSREIEVKFENMEERSEIGFRKSFTIELSDSAKSRYTIPITYEKEKPQVASGQNRQIPGATAVQSTGLRTNNGNSIKLIKAGTSNDG